MFVLHSLPIAIFFCLITMLGWGSWANTQKLSGKDQWRFELYYWDYVLGVLLFGLIFAFTFGSAGASGQPALANFQQAAHHAIHPALLSGVIFNVGNIMLVVGIDAAGMAVAFPVGVGLALVIGTVESYVQTPKGNPALLFPGVLLILFAMVMSGLAYRKLPQSAGKKPLRGLVFSVLAGCIMGFFYPELMRGISANFNNAPIYPGMLTPYMALVLFGIGVVGSNFVLNTIFMRAGKLTYADYFRGSAKLHLIGILGGVIWMVALCFNVIASGVAGPAISYALGQGATLIAAIWGVLVWRELDAGPKGTKRFAALMFAGYAIGLLLIGLATQ
jgi:glucose uptake protein